MKQWPIWNKVVTYVYDTKVTKIIWTDRKWKLKELDIQKWVY